MSQPPLPAFSPNAVILNPTPMSFAPPHAPSKEAIKESLYQWIFGAPHSSLEAEACSICLEDYKEGDAMGSLECGHHFHTQCVLGWILKKNLCPICRNPCAN